MRAPVIFTRAAGRAMTPRVHLHSGTPRTTKYRSQIRPLRWYHARSLPRSKSMSVCKAKVCNCSLHAVCLKDGSSSACRARGVQTAKAVYLNQRWPLKLFFRRYLLVAQYSSCAPGCSHPMRPGTGSLSRQISRIAADASWQVFSKYDWSVPSASRSNREAVEHCAQK